MFYGKLREATGSYGKFDKEVAVSFDWVDQIQIGERSFTQLVELNKMA